MPPTISPARLPIPPSTAAVNAFVEAMEIEVNEEAARNLFGLYLRNKAQVMRDCAALF